MAGSGDKSWSWDSASASPGASSNSLPAPAGSGDASAASRSGKSNTGGADTPAKPKITKSRNGCVTCKAKRLKCDETKPTCMQCKKRNVECGGYKKDFKWKPFEESSFMKPGARRKGPVTDQTIKSNESAASGPASTPPTTSHGSFSPSGATSNDPLLPTLLSGTGNPSSRLSQSPRLDQYGFGSTLSPSFSPSDRSGSRSPVSPYMPSPMQYSANLSATMGAGSQTLPLNLSGSGVQLTTFQAIHGHGISTDTAMGATVGERASTRSGSVFVAGNIPIAQTLDQEVAQWQVKQGVTHFDLPQIPPSTQSMLQHPSYMDVLLNIFITETCYVLAMERGEENPWKKYMLPMAQSCPSLMHAILALTAFRASARRVEAKAFGIEHKAEALRHLGSDMTRMSPVQALATTLALSIAEAFDSSQTLPEQYLLMSRSLMVRTLSDMQQGALTRDQLAPASFVLHNWMYMDVMMSLTSKTHTFDARLSHEILAVTRSIGLSPPIDSCMGVATSLFPFIGRVANLVHIVRHCQVNDANILAEAENLKKLLTRWGPIHTGSTYGVDARDLEDFQCTAEAFRWAALLLLHQAVPEVALKASAGLATRILRLLSSVKSGSPCLVFHIFPLLVAGSEATENQDRAWVMRRWQELGRTLQVGIVTKCMELSREVWRRRDAAATPSGVVAQMEFQFDMNFPGSTFGMSGSEQQVGNIQYNALGSDAMMNQALEQHMLAMQPQPRVQALQGELLSEEEIIRILGETTGFGIPSDASVMQRQSPEATEHLPYAQTVRGNQNWLGLMDEWGWEVWIA